MSTWTNEKHEAARARCEAATAGPWEDQPDRTGTATIVLDQEGDALWDAVGTLRDEDGVFIAHARADIPALLDEIERLRALTTLTDDMVKRAGEALYENFEAQSPHWNYTNGDFQGATLDGGYDFETALRAALEAALTEKEDQS